MTKKKEKVDKGSLLMEYVFNDCRIAALAGEKNTGKTNNLVYLLLDFHKHNKDVQLVIYGFDEITTELLINKCKAKVVNHLAQLNEYRNSLFVLDEAQKLEIHDRKQKDIIDNLTAMIYHKKLNNRLIISSPQLRTFNKQVCAVVQKWLIKSVYARSCINGSILKEIIETYKGSYKGYKSIIMEPNNMLVWHNSEDVVLNCGYIESIDEKRKIKKWN